MKLNTTNAKILNKNDFYLNIKVHGTAIFELVMEMFDKGFYLKSAIDCDMQKGKRTQDNFLMCFERMY